MAIRMSGLSSGLDTESIVEALMEAQKMKKTKVENKKTKLEWKQDKWKDFNTKLYSLYTDHASKLRLKSNYNTKKTSVSDSSVANVTAKNSAINGSYTLEVNNIATANYVTGAKMELQNSSSGTKIIGSTKLSELKGGADLVGKEITASYKDKTRTFEVTAETTITEYTEMLKSVGLSASFDEGQQRLFVSSGESGAANNFTMTVSSDDAVNKKNDLKNLLSYDALDADAKIEVDAIINALVGNAEGSDTYNNALDDLYAYASGNATNEAVKNAVLAYKNAGTGSGLEALGVTNIVNGKATGTTPSGMALIEGTDSEIVLNGAVLTGSDTTMNVNGLSIELKGVTSGSAVKFSISNDKEAAYDSIKSFIQEYNSILSELNKAYYAESARGYDPLTSEEKEAMTDEEIELWEDKIKGSLLKNDSTLYGVINSMKNAMMTSVEVDGKSYTLSSLGIMTSKDYTEKGLLHIYGDEDDPTYGDLEDKLGNLLDTNPDLVTDIMSGIADNLYQALNKKMGTSTLSSALTFYNDKQIKSQLNDYKKEISQWDTRLTDLENRYYKQFTAMEKAMADMQSKQSSLASMLG